MFMKKIFIPTVLTLLIGFSGFSQTDSTQNSIDQQFSKLIEQSNTFKGYKVVDYSALSSLKTNMKVHLNALRQEIGTLKDSLQSQNKNIANLKSQTRGLHTEIEELSAEKDALVFLGMPIEKSAYKTIMWGLVAILLFSLAFFVYRFKQSHVHTRQARKDLEATEKEFEIFRKKSLEKEQKLGRLLQDERNKLMKIAK